MLGDAAFDKIKLIFDEILFGLRYGSDDEDDSEGENAATKRKKTSDFPRVTACLSLLLGIVLSSRVTIRDVADYITEIATGTFVRVFDHLSEVMEALTLQPRDLLAAIAHVDGIVRVLNHLVAADNESSKISSVLKDQFIAIFSACKVLLRNHRHAMYTSFTSSSAESTQSSHRRGPTYDSCDDDERQNSRVPTQKLTQKSQFSDDSDGFMDDAEDIGPSRSRMRPFNRSAPPPKRRRVENKSLYVKQDGADSIKRTIDCQGAWSCASIMILLNPSIECLEIITGHLVWPEDYDSEQGYSAVSKSLNPCGAIVCASLFCQKSVIVREHLLQSKGKDDQQSTIALCVEVILQARRHLPPSSKYFMHGVGLLMDLIEFGDRSESGPFISKIESKIIIDALYPEGLNQDHEDYRLMRQLKKILKFRGVYLAEQLHASIGLFLRGQDNIHSALDAIYSEYFIKVIHSLFSSSSRLILEPS
jgi:hypothetical protein